MAAEHSLTVHELRDLRKEVEKRKEAEDEMQDAFRKFVNELMGGVERYTPGRPPPRKAYDRCVEAGKIASVGKHDMPLTRAVYRAIGRNIPEQPRDILSKHPFFARL